MYNTDIFYIHHSLVTTQRLSESHIITVSFLYDLQVLKVILYYRNELLQSLLLLLQVLYTDKQEHVSINPKHCNNSHTMNMLLMHTHSTLLWTEMNFLSRLFTPFNYQ